MEKLYIKERLKERIGEYMENGKMKNMVVLKNLPSNLVEEAIIILKSSKKVKKLERIDKKSKANKEKKKSKIKERDYIIKEAEMLISSYISKLENKPKNNPKFTWLKRYSCIATVVIVIQTILLIL